MGNMGKTSPEYLAEYLFCVPYTIYCSLSATCWKKRLHSFIFKNTLLIWIIAPRAVMYKIKEPY